MFILCDDIMEMIGKEVYWKRTREKWNIFYVNLINSIHYDFWDLDYMEHKKLQMIWYYWKIVIYNKLNDKRLRWQELCNSAFDM